MSLALSDAGREVGPQGYKLTIEREIVIMKLVEHPNVMSLWDVHEIEGTL